MNLTSSSSSSTSSSLELPPSASFLPVSDGAESEEDSSISSEASLLALTRLCRPVSSAFLFVDNIAKFRSCSGFNFLKIE